MEHNITGIFIKEVAPTAVRKAVLMTAEQAKSLYEQNKTFRDTLLSEFTDSELGITPKMKAWGGGNLNGEVTQTNSIL